MRATRVALASSLVLLVAATISHAQTCTGLDADTRKALYYLIDHWCGVGQVKSEDKPELQWADETLVRTGKTALPCLLDIYQHGPSGELWHGKGPAPTQGRWALTVIREIDPKSALPLYQRIRDEVVGDEIALAQINAEMVILGDATHFDEVLRFLGDPPQVTPAETRKLTYAQERALVAVSVQNDRRALPTLQKLADSLGDKHVLAVYTAQLSGDVAAVEESLKDPRVRDTGLLVLRRMGRDDVLHRIADDTKNPASVAATAVLEGRLGR